jgi:hypothetical protein
MMNEDLDDVHCTVQHNEFTDVQGDHRDPLVGHRDQRRKRAIESLVIRGSYFRVSEYSNPRKANP